MPIIPKVKTTISFVRWSTNVQGRVTGSKR